MKKTIGIIFLLIIIGGGYLASKILSSTTKFEGDKKILYIKTDSDYDRVRSQLQKGGFIKNTRIFDKLAGFYDYSKNIIPGRYIIESGSSIYSILNKLKAGEQTPVDLTITKLRTRENLISKIASNFECDSLSVARFVNSNDSLAAYNLNTNTVMTSIIPNNYQILWTTPFIDIFKRLYKEQENFWTEEKKQKAKAMGFTPKEIYTIASIVDEETNKDEDRGKIASVYINRLRTGMNLGADPTIKFALNDFSLTRILHEHLKVQSPYNTYINRGLPPGPICTPSIKSIDATLNAPTTNYTFFVAKPEMNGYSNFATTYAEHLKFAKAYQDALDELMRKKREEEKNKAK